MCLLYTINRDPFLKLYSNRERFKNKKKQYYKCILKPFSVSSHSGSEIMDSYKCVLLKTSLLSTSRAWRPPRFSAGPSSLWHVHPPPLVVRVRFTTMLFIFTPKVMLALIYHAFPSDTLEHKSSRSIKKKTCVIIWAKV